MLSCMHFLRLLVSQSCQCNASTQVAVVTSDRVLHKRPSVLHPLPKFIRHVLALLWMLEFSATIDQPNPNLRRYFSTSVRLEYLSADHNSPLAATMAYPITPPYATSSNHYACGVDYHRKEYVVGWSGPWQTPSLVGFPHIEGLAIKEVYQSVERQRCWQHSTLLAYGSYAYVRVFDEPSDFPILKMSHNGDAKRLFIRNEFEILKSLNSLPVVRVQRDPISDERGLFGFRMQELYGIDVGELAKRLDELEEAIKTVHRAGIVINDVSISNIMRDAEGNIRLIDFGFAGRVGHKVPAYFPPWKSQQPFFSIETDTKDFEELLAVCK